MLLIAGVAAVGLGTYALASGGEDAARPCTAFCVSVSPKSGDTETVFMFRGTRWRGQVTALFGPYCAERDCEDEGRFERFRPRPDGTWTFRFRRGPAPLSGTVPGPAANGGGPLQFEGWTGRAYRSRRVLREPRFAVRGAED